MTTFEWSQEWSSCTGLNLLSSCGSNTYKLLKSLVAPEDIGRSSHAEIKF